MGLNFRTHIIPKGLDADKEKLIQEFFDRNKVLIKSEDVDNLAEFVQKMLILRARLLDFRGIDGNAPNYPRQEKKMFCLLDEFFGEAERQEKIMGDSILIARMKSLFRNLMIDAFSQSEFLSYSIEKPRGYPGDFKIIEKIYTNSPESKGFSLMLDRYLLQNVYAEAIRYRKNMSRDILGSILSKSNIKKIKVLNLACGSCREIRELSWCEIDKAGEITFLLIDQDHESLEFAERELGNLDTRVKFNFLKSDVVAFLRNNTSASKPEKFDLIYCIGLADYFPDSILISLIKHAVGSLSLEGAFILAHKNTKLFKFTISDWAADWRFVPRDAGDLIGLIRSCPEMDDFSFEFLNDKNLPIFFMKFKRKQ